jgi:hypothetical protein
MTDRWEYKTRMWARNKKTHSQNNKTNIQQLWVGEGNKNPISCEATGHLLTSFQKIVGYKKIQIRRELEIRDANRQTRHMQSIQSKKKTSKWPKHITYANFSTCDTYPWGKKTWW